MPRRTHPFAPISLLLALAVGLLSSAAAQQQQEVLYDLMTETNVMIPMRDGTLLATDIYRPDAEGQFPTLFQRTHYGKTNPGTADALFFVERGYVVVAQDARGRFASEGDWYLNLSDGWLQNKDGYDTLEWISQQPWSDGQVAMSGRSQGGITTLQVPPTQHPAYVTGIPLQTGSNLHEGWFYRGGAFEHGFNTLWTALSFASDVLARRLEGDALTEALARTQVLTAAAFAGMGGTTVELPEAMWHLPLSELPTFIDLPGFDFYYDWVTHPNYGFYWAAQDISTQYDKFDIPMFHIGGWYDIFVNGTIENYVGIRDHGGTELARANQKLMMGPWDHISLTPSVGQLEFPGAEWNYDETRLPWVDHWLKGIDTGIMDEPPVRLYVMGDNEWRFENEWPLARTVYTNFYLHDAASGTIDSLNDGTLSTAMPSAAEAATTFEYDPSDPVMTMGGNTLFLVAGPRDHQDADVRSLTYTSEVLEADLEVTGHVTAVLYGSSSAVDTDWTVRVSEVYPDGTSINIVDGIQRARYRESSSTPTLLTPDEVYAYHIDLTPTSNVFQAGNRIRVSIHSSNFPRFSRNLNTAVSPEQGTEMVVAMNTVHHDELRPSHVILPVIPR